MYVQFGGFNDCPEGWTNFEPSIHLRAQRWPLLGPFMRRLSPHRFDGAIRVGDVLKGLPVADAAATAVFSSHVLEHLSHQDACAAIGETFRILKPGGVFRCVLPDLQSRAQFYLEQQDTLEEPAAWLLDSTLLGHRAQPGSPVKRIAAALFSTTDHKWMWDFRSLSHVLKLSGFDAPRRAAFSDAADPMFARVEKRERFFWSPSGDLDKSKDLIFAELAVEAVKPVNNH